MKGLGIFLNIQLPVRMMICHTARNQVGIHKQDKVNYAVSEKEERVTDLTTLTRMTGCTGMYWAANGLY